MWPCVSAAITGGQDYALWHRDTVVVADPANRAAVARQLVDSAHGLSSPARCDRTARSSIERVARYSTDAVDAPMGAALLTKMRSLTAVQGRRWLAGVLESAHEHHPAMMARSIARPLAAMIRRDQCAVGDLTSEAGGRNSCMLSFESSLGPSRMRATTDVIPVSRCELIAGLRSSEWRELFAR